MIFTTPFFIRIFLTAFSVICLSITARGEDIPFAHSLIDKDAHGKRCIGDIDRDGAADIIVRTETRLLWYKYPGWDKHLIEDSENFRGDDMEIGDVDGDGDPDIIVTVSDSGRVYWYENPAPSKSPMAGTWIRHYIGTSQKSKVDEREATGYVAPGDETRYVKDIESADFDGNGRLDVVTRTHGDVYIWLQNDSGMWSMVHLGIRYKEGMDVGDIDSDGDPDIVLNGYWLENPESPLYGTWLEHNIDSKWWDQFTGKWMDNCCKVSVADLNNDGCMDVLLSHSEKSGYPVSWYETSNPKGGPWIEHVITRMDFCHSLQVADMNKDGELDVVAGEMAKSDGLSEIAVFLNEGNANSFRKQRISNAGTYSAVVGDVGSDGRFDIVGNRLDRRSEPHPPVEIWENRLPVLSLDKWTYIVADSVRGKWGDFDGFYAVPPEPPDWRLRYIGLDMKDLTGDGYKDIASGRYFYRNPGGDMQEAWERIDFGINVDAMMIVDVDGDELGDVIAQALPDVYWFEAQDSQGNSWNARKIASLPQTGHRNSQGYRIAQIVPGGKPEILFGAGDGTYYIEIPGNPESGKWPCTLISHNETQGIGVGDIDRDGYMDIATLDESGESPRKIVWHRNPKDGTAGWRKFTVGNSITPIPDRCSIADINGDGRLDIIVSDETRLDNASLYWFEQPLDPMQGSWPRHKIVTEYTLNSMDVADMDRDGDLDIIVGEHKGAKRLQIWENDGKGNFREHCVDAGKESHLGARVVDLDGDGDLDIVSHAWNENRYLHVWRNNAIDR